MKNDHKKLSSQLTFMPIALHAVVIAAVSAVIYLFILKDSPSAAKAVISAALMIAAVCVSEYFLIATRTKKLAAAPIDEVKEKVSGYMSSAEGTAVREGLEGIESQNEIKALIDEIGSMTLRADEHIKGLETENKEAHELMEGVMSALASAIDAKDKYTRGHSARVAGYAVKIAQLSGRSQAECRRVYYAALLHDVGKIGVPESIINKKGRLTDEEYQVIKQHPVMGARILERVKDAPYLSIGARSHHERYDGKGYPDNLKGTDIPEIARMIAVADAYDAMTSMRSYRAPIPQKTVRDELVKGSGTQFDPEFAQTMLKMIDMDIEYEMIDGSDQNYLDSEDELIIDSHRSDVSPGVSISAYMTTVHIKVKPYNRSSGVPARPSLILYNALDGQVHTNVKDIRDLEYFEYGEIWFDGNTTTLGAKKMQTTVINQGSGRDNEYTVEAVVYKDHSFIRITGKTQTFEVITALPDTSRFAHIAFTGEHCSFIGVRTEQAEEEIAPDFIPRIVEEVSYIDDSEAEGDIPNVQIDGYRMTASRGIAIEDGMQLTFHAKSLPSARRVWHCPFLNVFSSDNGEVKGGNYRDLMIMRLDGECWGDDPESKVKSSDKKTDAFTGWDNWKARNKEGFDCTFDFEMKAGRITVRTENGGIVLESAVDINNCPETVYAAVTGDHCVITNIRIKRP